MQYTREMEQTGVQWDLAIRAVSLYSEALHWLVSKAVSGPQHTAIATLLRARGRGVPHMLTLLGNSEERNKEARKRRAERRKRRAMKKRRRKKRLKREQTAAKEAAKAGETIDYGNVSDVSSVSSVSTSSVSESSGDEETMVLLRAGTKVTCFLMLCACELITIFPGASLPSLHRLTQATSIQGWVPPPTAQAPLESML